MSDVVRRLADIEARLGAASPGPWELCLLASHAQDDIPWLVDQLRQTRDLLAQFAALNPLDWHEIDDNDGYCVETLWFCWCCDRNGYSRETFVHSPDCLWVAARAMLGMEEKGEAHEDL
jgi:hypothetical protein